MSAVYLLVPRLELWEITFMLAAGMLAYEILLTRVASVQLTSDPMFFALTLGLLADDPQQTP